MAKRANPKIHTSEDVGRWTRWEGKGWHLALFASGDVILHASFDGGGSLQLQCPADQLCKRWQRATGWGFGPSRSEVECAVAKCSAALDESEAA